MPQPTQAQTFGVNVLPQSQQTRYDVSQFKGVPLDLTNYFTAIKVDQGQQQIRQQDVALNQAQQRIDIQKDQFEMAKGEYFQDLLSTNTMLNWANGNSKNADGSPNFIGQNAAQLKMIEGINADQSAYKDQMASLTQNKDFIAAARVGQEASEKLSSDPRISKLIQDQSSIEALIKADTDNQGYYDPLVLQGAIMGYYADQKGDFDANKIRSIMADPMSKSGKKAWEDYSTSQGYKDFTDKQTLAEIAVENGFIVDKISDVEPTMESIRQHLREQMTIDPALAKEVYGQYSNGEVMLPDDDAANEAILDSFIYRNGMATQAIQEGGEDIYDNTGKVVGRKMTTNHEQLGNTVEDEQERLKNKGEIQKDIYKTNTEVENSFKTDNKTKKVSPDAVKQQERLDYNLQQYLEGNISLQEAYLNKKRLEHTYYGGTDKNFKIPMDNMDAFVSQTGKAFTGDERQKYLEDNPKVRRDAYWPDGTINKNKPTLFEVDKHGSLVTNDPEILRQAGVLGPNQDMIDLPESQLSPDYLESTWGKVYIIPGEVKYNEEAMQKDLGIRTAEQQETYLRGVHSTAKMSYTDIDHTDLKADDSMKAVTKAMEDYFEFGPKTDSLGTVIGTVDLKEMEPSSMSFLAGTLDIPALEGLGITSTVRDWGKTHKGEDIDIGLGDIAKDPNHPNWLFRDWLKGEITLDNTATQRKTSGEMYMLQKGYEALQEGSDVENSRGLLYGTKNNTNYPHIHMQRFQPKEIILTADDGTVVSGTIRLQDPTFESNLVMYVFENAAAGNPVFTPEEMYNGLVSGTIEVIDPYGKIKAPE